MHWEILIIPLIALGVWILGTIFKGEEERARGPNRPRGPGEGRTRRPVTDLDRFLEEARRRRDGEKRPPRTAVARPAPVIPEAQSVRVPRPPKAREVSLPEPTRRAEQPATIIPFVLPVESPPPVEPSPAPSLEPTTTVKHVTAGAPAALSPSRQQGASPILQQVRSLLNKPQTAGTAFVLREIFDRPLCQRRRS
jgi:hypothetical protein